jgi:hypothetical protein
MMNHRQSHVCIRGSFYGYWQGHNQVSVYQLPVELQWGFTSTTPRQQWIPNKLSFSFDVHQFRQQMRQRAEDHLRKQYLQQKEQLQRARQLKQKGNEVNNLLNSDEVQKLQSELSQYDSLKRAMEEKGSEWSEGKREKVEQQISQMERKNKVVQHLQNRKQRIDSMREITGPYDSLQRPRKYEMERLQNPDLVQQELQKAGQLSSVEKVALQVERLQFGRITPSWSPLTLQGVTVDGVDVAGRPGGVYVGGIAGNVYPSYQYGRLMLRDSSMLNRSVLGAQMGYQHGSGNGIRAQVLHFQDQETELTHPNQATPKSNYVMNVQGDWSFWKDKLHLHSALAGSQTNYNRMTQEEENIQIGGTSAPTPDEPSTWFTNILYQRSNSLHFSTGWAYRGHLEFQPLEKGPVLTGSYEHTSPHYQSFGVPFLINDIAKWDAKLRQQFWNDNVDVEVGFGQYIDNLTNRRPYTTHWDQYEGTVRLRIPEGPTAAVSYRPMYRQNFRSYWMHVWNLQSSYQWQMKNWQNLLTGTYTFYTNAGRYQSHNVAFYDQIQTPWPLKVSLNGMYYYRVGDDKTSDLLRIKVMPSYTLFDQWDNGFGLNWYNGQVTPPKTGFIYETSVRFWQQFRFSLWLSYDQFKNRSYVGRDIRPSLVKQNSFNMRTKLSVKW